MKLLIFLSTCLALNGCVSYSRHAYILADTKSTSVAGACGQARFQNYVTLKNSEVRVYAQTFTESSWGGIIIPFAFHKSDGVVFFFENVDKAVSKENLKKIRLIDHDKKLAPSHVAEIVPGHFEVKFPVSTLKDIQDFRVDISSLVGTGRNDIHYKTDKSWYFIPILPLHSTKCSVRDEV